ncbi:MAG: sulfatase-like hydrolase/transferase [Vicinamibacteria bacterium]
MTPTFAPTRSPSGKEDLGSRWAIWLGLTVFADISLQGTAGWWFKAIPVLLAVGGGAALLAVRPNRAHPRLQLLLGSALIVSATPVMYLSNQGSPLPRWLTTSLAGLQLLLALLFLFEPPWPSNAGVGQGRGGAGPALAACIMATTGMASFWLFGSPEHGARVWLVALCTFSWGWVIPLSLCVVPGVVGLALTAFVWLPLAGWQVASLWLGAAQGRPLLAFEVMERVEATAGLAFVPEALMSRPGIAVVIAISLIGIAVSRLRARHHRGENLHATAHLAAAAVLIGLPTLRAPEDREIVRQAAAPWSRIHPAPPPHAPFRHEALARVLKDDPAWESGVPSTWASWAGAYRGRSVVLVVLESQAATYLPEFGAGSSRNPQTSPELWSRRFEGVFLSNYFASAPATRNALWSIGTGLPDFGIESLPSRSPEAAQFGALARLGAAGYKTEWICPTPPEFDGWNFLWTAAAARWWLDPAETAGFDRGNWTSWGMPDEQLYRLVLARIARLSARPEPYLLGVLTVSNHPPYSLPLVPGRPVFSADNFGGAGYADFAVGRFLSAIGEIDEQRRPLVLVTADHGYQQDLNGMPPLGVLNLEAIRIPGILILPDGRAAGTVVDEVFTHEDSMALIELLVGPTRPGSRFLSSRRVMASYSANLALGPRTLLLADGRLFRISNRWRLDPVEGLDPDRAPLTRMLGWLARSNAELWPSRGESPR